MRMTRGFWKSLGERFHIDSRLKQRRGTRSNALHRAVMDTLEPKLLMTSVGAAVFETTTYGDYFSDGTIATTLHWVNHTSNATQIIVEAKELDTQFGDNYFSLSSLNATASSATINLQVDASYEFRLRTITPDGSIFSDELPVTTDTWDTADYNVSLTDVDHEDFFLDDGVALHWDDTNDTNGMYWLARNSTMPYPDRWQPVQNYGMGMGVNYGSGSVLGDNGTDSFATATNAFDTFNHGNDAFLASSAESVLLHGSGSTTIDYADRDTFGPFNTVSSPTSVHGTLSTDGTTVTISYGAYSGTHTFDKVDAQYNGVFLGEGDTSAGTFSFAASGVSPSYSFGRSGYYLIFTHVDEEHTSPGVWLDLSKAEQPSFLTATPSADGSSVHLEWDNNAYNETHYEIYRADGPGTVTNGTGSYWTLVHTASPDETNWTDTSANDKGQTYHYEVRAVRDNAVLDSDWANASSSYFANCPECLAQYLLQSSAMASAPPASGSSGGATNGGGVNFPLKGLSGAAATNFGAQAVISAGGSGDFGTGAHSGGIPEFKLFHNVDGSFGGTIRVTEGTNMWYWNFDGTSCSSINDNTFSMSVVDLGGGIHAYSVTDDYGNVVTFNCGDTDSDGLFQKWRDQAGNVQTASYSSGRLHTVSESLPGGHSQTLTYTYGTSSGSEPIARIALSYDGGSATESQSFVYNTDKTMRSMSDTIYSGTVATSTTVTYMRYANVGGLPRLEYVVSGSNYDRLIADNGTSYLTASLTNYADFYNQYDDVGRLIQTVSQGTGCSLCTAGLGTTAFAYTTSPFYLTTSPSYNVWMTKRVEIAPGFDASNTANMMNTQIITYSNYVGQTLLQVTVQTATGAQWMDYYRYDSNGNLIMHATPSAMSRYDETLSHLVSDYNSDTTSDSSTGTDIRNDYGLIAYTDYEMKNAGNSSAWFAQDTYITHGDGGSSSPTKYYQSYFEYDEHLSSATGLYSTNVSNSVVFSGDVTSSPGTSSPSARVTHYGYTYAEDANSSTSYLQIVTVTNATVSASHNGSELAETTQSVFDSFGRTLFTQDADGFINYTAYDATTGAVTKAVTDVDYSLLSGTEQTLLNNASLSHHGSGLNLVANFTNDSLGRTVVMSDPKGNKTYMVYDDANHAIFSFPGASQVGTTSSMITTGPITMTRTQIPYVSGGVTDTYDETVTFSGTVTLSGGRPVAPGFSSTNHNLLNFATASSQYTIQSLSRSLYNSSGQLVESDGYYAIDNATYLSTGTASAYSGSAAANFYATHYDYNLQGNQARTVSPTGTITIETYDLLGRLVGTFVGTNDTPGTDLNGSGGSPNWEDFIYAANANPFSLPTSSNMTLVSMMHYDYDGVGDGNMTQAVQFPGSSQALRATEYLYDWRNRMISSKSGVPVTFASGFSDADYGLPGRAGTASFDGSTFIIKGGGGGLNGTSSQFNFVSKSVSGNTTLIGRVESLTNVDSGAMAGLMIQNGTAANAVFAAVVVTPGDIEFLWRSTAGTTTMVSAISDITGPVSLKLVRSSNDFNAFYSTDNGSTWLLIGATQSITMSSGVLAGLAVTANNNSALSVARMDGISIGGTAVTTAETDGVHRPLTVSTLDNLGENLAGYRFDGDGVSMVDKNGDGVPDALDHDGDGVPTDPDVDGNGTVDTNSPLRALTSMQYDEQGRGFRTATYSVNPTTGSYSTASSDMLVSNVWFDHRGNTITSHSPGGPTSKMTYDGAGRLAVSYTTDGGAVNNATASGSILSDWSNANSISSDIVLSQIEYTYDGDSNVILTTDRERFHDNATNGTGSLTVAGTTNTAARVSFVATYYDAANRTIETVNPGTNGGALYTRPMDANSTVNARSDTLLITNYSYNAAGEVETIIDPKGLASKTLFDPLGRQIKTIANFDATVNSGNASGSFNQTTLYGYDSAGHLSTMTAVMPTGTPSQSTSYLYGVTTVQGSSINSNDLLRMTEYPISTGGSAGQSGTTSAYMDTFTYDAAGATHTKTDRNGATHTYTYDILGRLTQDVASTKPTLFGIVHETVANSGFESGASSWSFGNDSGVTSGNGGSVGYLQRDSGVDATISQSVQITGGTYYVAFSAKSDNDGTDSGSFIVKVDGTTVWSGSANWSDFTRYSSSSFTVTSGSHTLSFITTGTDGFASYIDDVAVGTAVSVSDSGFESTNVGGANHFQQNPTGSAWSYLNMAGVAHDGALNVPGGHGGGQVGYLQSSFSGSISGTAAIYQTVHLAVGTYSLTFSAAEGDGDGQEQGITAFVHGVDDHTVVTAYPGADFETFGDRFQIVTAGDYVVKFIGTQDGTDGTTLAFIDDIRIILENPGTVPANVVAAQSIVTTYNSQGLVDTITSYDAAVSGNVVNQVKRTYNGFGQVAIEYQAHNGTVNTSTTAKVSYTYETSNVGLHGSRLTSETNPTSSVTYSYGTSNRLNDAISRIESITGTGGETYSYLGLSTIVERVRNDSTKLTYLKQGAETNGDAGDKYTGLDRFGRVVDQRWITSGGTSLDRYQYAYDRDSNVTGKINVNHTSFNETYTYDGLNRLTAVDQAGGTTNDQSWSLDANGNMTSVTTNGTTLNRTHNSDNQITAIGSSTLSYDNNGNMTVDDSGNILIWDAWNRLVEVTDSAGTLIKAYTYDGLGRKVTETDGFSTHDMYYNTGWQLVEEKIGGTLDAAYVWGAGYSDALIFRSSSASDSYFATYDANYNVTGIEVSGSVQEHFLYNAYGKRADLSSSWSSSTDTKKWVIGFQGMRWDKETGLFYQRNRWYDPDLMRWSSWDIIGYSDGMNPMAFVGGNPINTIDPTGLAKYVFAFEGYLGYDVHNWENWKNDKPFDGNLLKRVIGARNGAFAGDATGSPSNAKVPAEQDVLSYYSYEDVQQALNFAASQKIGQEKTKNGKCYYDTVVVTGHSFGGDAAWEFALKLTQQTKIKGIVNLGITFDPRWPGKAGGNDWNPDWEQPMPANEWWNYWEHVPFTLTPIPLDLHGNELPSYQGNDVHNVHENGDHFAMLDSAAADSAIHVKAVGYARKSPGGNDYISL